METIKKYKFLIVLLIGFILGSMITCSLNSKGSVKETVSVNIPAQVGKSDTVYKPVPVVSIKDHYIYKNDTVITESSFNKELADKYVDLEKRYEGIDLEKERLKAYLKSIEVRDYKIPFEDDYIKIKNNIKAQGEIISFQQDYEIKLRTIDAQITTKEKKYNFYGGGEVGTGKDLNKFVAKSNLFMQIPKGDMINISYDTDKRFWVGYTFKF